MPRLVVSTVGTSLLTNQIRERLDPKGWSARLKATANCTYEEVQKHHTDVVTIIEELKSRSEKKLSADDTELQEIREASAELNGIYGLYQEQLQQGKSDMHWLIATDTAQGQVTAELVKSFLQKNGLIADIYTPKELCTASTESFTNGIDELLKWLDDIIPGYKDGYQICFNLVGGFKALQGYANTIGMLYGVEIIYVFEGNYEVIKIPRLPIQVDYSVIKPVQFALMATELGVWVKLSELNSVPETLILVAGDEATLSHWGRLTWNNCKWKFLTGNLLEFPRLVYEKSFLKDYDRNNLEAKRKFELQEVLTEISASTIKFDGNTTRFDPRLHFTRYEGEKRCEGGVKKNQIDHFYIKNTGRRVSCIAKDRKLYLRHYGEHDYVNENP